MALEAAAWITRGDHKQDSGIFIASTNEHDRVILQSGNKSNLAQTNRFTQTDQSNGYLCSSNGRPVKDAQVMFDQNVQVQQQQQQHQQQQHQQQQHSMYSQNVKKECDKSAVLAEFPFCYNMNVLQKAQQETVATSNVASIVMDGDKACYRFDVSQPFTYNYALVNQMSLAAATSTANVKCDICGLTFANLSLLNNHKRIHSNIATQPHASNFSCNTCGCGFNDATELKSHRISAHKVRCCSSCGIEVTCEKSGKKSKLLKCENCISISNSFVNDQSTPVSNNNNGSMENTSAKNHHPVKRKGLATVTKCHKCNGSGIIFIGVSRNMDSTKPFQCNICNGRFSRYSSLWSHKRLHTGDKPFKCDVCGLGFAKAAYLKNHSRTHTGEKPFKCEICGMQFSQSPHLKNHERIHSGERPYQCEVCEKTFARHSTLWNHRRIHTGEKPYRCDICGSAFNQATHLKNHGKVHTGEKPHRCTVCAVGFSDRFALKRHQKIHEKYARQGNNEQQQQQQQTDMDNVFKYEVTGPIAFPGCTRPQEK